VGIRPGDFIRRYPRLYHMAALGSWDSVRRHGLLSTSALLDLFEIEGNQRTEIEAQRRPESRVIEHPEHGRAVVRDQKPMSESALRKRLVGIQPEQWYRELNSKVLFWPTAQRLHGLLTARAYHRQAHTVLVVDTKRLFERHLDRVRLSPLNSGSTVYNPQKRGSDTFRSLTDFPFEERRRRGLQPVTEVAVQEGLLDIAELVVRVSDWERENELRVIYER
jgi:hypothetical protein